MPDLWGYQNQQGYGYGHGQGQGQGQQELRGRMSLDHSAYAHSGRAGMGMGMGMGMDEGLASQAYLSSLLRVPPRRESMPIMLPSNYGVGGGGGSSFGMGIGGGGGGERYSPTPNLFNGYQMTTSSTSHVGGIGAGNGSGCSRDIPRSITPSSTSLTTPQPWDLPPVCHFDLSCPAHILSFCFP